MVMKVLVTGAAGFVGRAVVARLAESANCMVTGTSRKSVRPSRDDVSMAQVDGLGQNTDWSHVLSGVDVVVHAAARVHVMNEQDENAADEYRRVNVDGTRRLAQQAIEASVKRLVFLSSIKVNGEETVANEPFTSQSVPNPVDPYGRSKLEAETVLFELGEKSGLEVVAIRPPLVYGPGAGANFKSLMSVVARGMPLPLLGVRNKRSLVYIQNLVDLIDRCTSSERAPGKVFLVSDGEDLSTPDLIRSIAAGLGRDARLFRVPTTILRLLGRMAGKQEAIARLTGSLQVDIASTSEQLDWIPPIPAARGLAETARAFRDESGPGKGR